ncbi:LytR/AlgR family response regulator transcription factor [Lysobacter silvisoli]|nr:LytTR family DNA-binding domain-containing protein [Lysobacter silvisoli]
MRVAVIDDEPLARSGVITRLAAHADVEVVGEFADGPSALEGIAALAPDLVFIDVQMPGMTGLEALAALPPAQRPMAVLLTAYENFAVRAFELQAVDYLLKPIDDERFAEALERARQAQPYRRSAAPAASAQVAAANGEDASWLNRFVVRVGRRVAFVEAAEVEWIQADGDYATLHVGDRAYLLRESMGRLSRQLDPAQFVRVHRSTIVRIDCVAELQPLSNRDAMLRLRDGTPVRASRTYIEPLLARLHGRPGFGG